MIKRISKTISTASSVIIAAAIDCDVSVSASQSPSQYKILFEKRSNASSFMPNNYVFPGGKAEVSDAAPVWLETFPELSAFHDWNIRISAIRETFEETGILLGMPADVYRNLKDEDLDMMRRVVYKQPNTFHDYISKITSDFNISELQPWHRFLPPTMVERKFDTMFYLVVFPQKLSHLQQELQANAAEVEKLEWLSPVEALERFSSHEIMLAPPQ